jgi:hypothetical protein
MDLDQYHHRYVLFASWLEKSIHLCPAMERKVTNSTRAWSPGRPAFASNPWVR